MSIEDPAALLQEIRQLEAELRSSADPLKSVRLKGLQERYHRATGREAPALATQQCSHNVTIIGGQGNVTAVGGGTAIGAITLTPPTSPSKENSEPPDATKGRVDLLILAANPLGSRRLDVEGEAEAIWKSLEPHSWRIKVVIETTPAQLDELLNLHQPRFLHFSGHGNPDGTLSFLDASKREHTVAPDRLAAQLQALGLFPELIFLNACYSHAAADALAGQTHWILGMTNRVSDDTARALSPKFYQALAEGQEVQAAYARAIAHVGIQNLQHEVPVLVPGKARPQAMGLPTIVSPSSLPNAEVFRAGGSLHEALKVRVWYGTNRKLRNAAKPAESFGNEINEGADSTRGTCDVLIPKGHQIGGHPWWSAWLHAGVSLDRGSLRILDSVSFQDSVADALTKAKSPQILLFLHGYNVDFDEAAASTGQLMADLSFPGIVAFFSWPSKGTLRGYPKDTETVMLSVPAILSYLRDLVAWAGPGNVHLLAHSMGNRALVEIARELKSDLAAGAPPPLGEVFLAAADVSQGIFRQHAAKFSQVARRTTLYASRRDWALWFSEHFNDQDRTGYYEPLTVMEGIDTIKAEAISMDLMGHGYYAGSRPVLNDIYHTIVNGTPPDQRGLRPAGHGTGAHWVLPQ